MGSLHAPFALTAIALASAAPPAVAQTELFSTGSPEHRRSIVTMNVTAGSEDIAICGFDLFLGKLGDGEVSTELVVLSAATYGPDMDFFFDSFEKKAEVSVTAASPFTQVHIELETPILVLGAATRTVTLHTADLIPLIAVDELPAGPGSNGDLTLTPFAKVPDEAFCGVIHYVTGTDECPEKMDLPVCMLPSVLFDGPGGGGPIDDASKIYVVTPGPFGWASVPDGMTFTASGVTLAMANTPTTAKQIHVGFGASLNLENTTITSAWNDEVGGDTDGQLGLPPKDPEKGDWDGIRFGPGSDGSLNGVLIQYGGGSVPPLAVNSAGPDLSAVVVSDNGSGGDFVLDLEGTGSPTVSGSLFANNDNPPIGNVPPDSIAGFEHNTAVGNLGGDYMEVNASPVIGSVGFTQDITISPHNYPGDWLVVDGNLGIPPAVSVEIDPGVGVKFPPGRRGGFTVQPGGVLDIDGSATSPVVLTSLDDDTLQDTAGDGPTSGQAGDLRGVEYLSSPQTGESSGEVGHLVVDFGGDSFIPSAAVRVSSNQVGVDSVCARSSSRHGIALDAVMGDATNLVAMHNTGDGVVISGDDDFDAKFVTTAFNGGMGFAKSSSDWSGGVSSAVAFGNLAGEFEPTFTAEQVRFSNGFAGGGLGNFVADPLIDPQTGALGSGSPSLGAGETPTQVPGELFSIGDVGRVPDAPSDQGALQSSGGTLEPVTPFQVGQLLELTFEAESSGPTSLFFALSTSPGAPSTFPGLGTLAFPLSSAVVVGPFVSPGGPTPVSFPIPAIDGVDLTGLDVAVQAAGANGGGPFLTNAVIGQLVQSPYLE